MNKKKSEGQTSTATVPKKPLSGFFLYRGEKFGEVKKQNATASITELTKIISNQWNSLDEKEKARFTEMSKKEREKYNIEMEKYVKENGPVEKIKRKKKKETTSGDSEEHAAKRKAAKKKDDTPHEEEGKGKKKVKLSSDTEEKKQMKENSDATKKKEAKEVPKKDSSVKAKKAKKEGPGSK